MARFLMILIMVLTSFHRLEAMSRDMIISDSTTYGPLSGASSCPGTIPHDEYNEKEMTDDSSVTVTFSETVSELPEVIVESRKYPLFHLLAYVREYSTLTTYSDTIFLFREKMVDYMIPLQEKVNFKGWSIPRILSSKSYYRFTNQAGLDSVSDECNYHFSWSDWVGLPPRVMMPRSLRDKDVYTDTLKGKYSPVEIWSKVNDAVDIHVNLLADTIGRKWLPNMSGFYDRGVDFDRFKVSYNYRNILGGEMSARDLESYSYSIESTGRGRNMFRFNRKDEPYYVSTDAEIYIIDKEYVTVKEANKWDKRNFDLDEIGIYVAPEAPPLPSHINELMASVDGIDKKEIRLRLKPDKRIGNSKGHPNITMGQKALSFIKKILKI